MSVVERAVGADADGQGKKRASADAAVQAEKSAIAARNTFDVDFDRLKEIGVQTPDKPSAQQALELRAIKRRLMRRIGFLRDSGDRTAHRAAGRQKNIIMVTSTAAGEGKTFSALNLAMSLAFEDKIDILLIDGDVQRPKVLSRFGLPQSPGLTELMRDPSIDPNALYLRASGAPLSILPQGGYIERASDLFDGPEGKAIWAALASEKSDRLVIVDAPPVLATTDAVVLAKIADEIVFVVEAGQTPESAITAALDELLDINANVSLMLNRCLIGAGGSHYGSYEYYDRRDPDDALAARAQED
ncbi:MAG: chromosome partitioning ATPase [Pseudomonadota bacterium]